MTDLIKRLRKRAEIRRSIPRGEPDRISDILEEAANALKNRKVWVLMTNWEYEGGYPIGVYSTKELVELEKKILEESYTSACQFATIQEFELDEGQVT